VLLRRDCALSTKVLEGMICVLELLEDVRRILEAVEIFAVVGTAGDALHAEVLEVVLKELEVVAGGVGDCAEGAGGCCWRRWRLR